MTLTESLSEVERRIGEACLRAGRKRDDVTLVAVSKTYPAEAVLKALDAGQTIFGENRVQELKDKAVRVEEMLQHEASASGKAVLSGMETKWHLIGTLQTNKVRYLPAVKGLEMIHSVDSMRLAQEIDRRFAADDPARIIDVLLEVNMAGEESKAGLAPEEASALLKEIADLKHIRVKGLMTIAPFTEDAETNRVHFKGLKDLLCDLNAQEILSEPMTELSMGMSGDYEVAIEEGATFIRVGTAIFGARD